MFASVPRTIPRKLTSAEDGPDFISFGRHAQRWGAEPQRSRGAFRVANTDAAQQIIAAGAGCEDGQVKGDAMG